jgi:predicted nucleotidyltransferase
MTRGTVERIFQALNERGVRYLVAGGLAVVAHGHVRFTADVDLILDLDDAANVAKAVAALSELGYRPRAPVPLEHFADPLRRADWIGEKGLVVFSLYSTADPLTEIDLFVEMPLDFSRSYASARREVIGGGVTVTFVGLEDLIRLKERAGRPQDLQDIEALRRLGGKDEDR